MADLVTHALSAVVCRGSRSPDGALMWLLTGVILPDLLARAPGVGLKVLQDQGLLAGLSIRDSWIYLGFNFPHTPIGIVLVSLLVAIVLPRWVVGSQTRGQVAYWLCLGGGLHLVVDLLQKHLKPGYFLFYPFSTQAFEFGLIRSDGSALFLPVLFFVSLVLLGPWLRTSIAKFKRTRPPSQGSSSSMD